ncbi:hypothetical protein [Mucilaginibacter paludis]|uniref:Lipoprotein n=1 Tax=Mucilaginibacter paludis DSM 18603 TaxID=714943 RepID=H1YC52_9SPHI|nr:hypothetical protein [Mucilaginibacter paludis]EHQ29615.1 hypothetical protein Mucpa_5544 [Mucilaginibacter paludis DSM 18603]
MKKSLLSPLFRLFVLSLFALSSCEKIPGHAVVPVTQTTTNNNNGSSGSTTGGGTTTTGGTGVGPVGIGATNTVIFQFNGTTYTWASPNYFMGLNEVPINPASSGKYSTTISAFDGVGKSIIIGYNATTAGTYLVDMFTITMSGVDLEQTGLTKSLYTKVTAESIHIINTVGYYAAGSVKGTFDGYVTNTNSSTNDSVRVSGSFNISQ